MVVGERGAASVALAEAVGLVGDRPGVGPGTTGAPTRRFPGSDERWRVDLPPDEKIAAKLDSGLKQLRDMDQEHVEAEENSPDAKELMEHDQKVAAILYDHKKNAQQEKSDENFTMDPRKMMAAAQQRREPKDVGQSLPSYLTNAMYELGVYSV